MFDLDREIRIRKGPYPEHRDFIDRRVDEYRNDPLIPDYNAEFLRFLDAELTRGAIETAKPKSETKKRSTPADRRQPRR